MAWDSLGSVTITTPGTRVQLTVNQPTDYLKKSTMAQSILVQALSNASHTNTGRIYVYKGETGNTRMATLAVPTTNTIPSCSATIPNAMAALNVGDYWIDADNATDGVDVSYLLP